MDRNVVGGFLLILLGAFLLTNKSDFIDPGNVFAYFWPTLFVIPLGLLFHWMYFVATKRKGAGLLIPGGILLVAGVVCQFSMLFDIWDYLWPGFPLAVAFGLLEFYWFGGRNKWLLIPVFILGSASLLFFAIFTLESILRFNFLGQSTIAVILIAAGYLYISSKKSRDFHV